MTLFSKRRKHGKLISFEIENVKLISKMIHTRPTNKEVWLSSIELINVNNSREGFLFLFVVK